MANLRAARRRRDESWSVGDEEFDSIGTGGGRLSHVQPVGGAGGVADEHAVEVGVLVGAGELAEVFARDPAANDVDGSVVLRRLDADHADEFDGHGSISKIGPVRQ